MFRSTVQDIHLRTRLSEVPFEEFVVKIRPIKPLTLKQLEWLEAFLKIQHRDHEGNYIAIGNGYDVIVASRFKFINCMSFHEIRDHSYPARPDKDEPEFDEFQKNQFYYRNQHTRLIRRAREDCFATIMDSLVIAKSCHELSITCLPKCDGISIFDAIYQNEKLNDNHRCRLMSFLFDELRYNVFFNDFLDKHYLKLQPEFLFNCFRAVTNGYDQYLVHRDQISQRLASFTEKYAYCLSLMITLLYRRAPYAAYSFINESINSLNNSSECVQFYNNISELAHELDLKELIVPINKMIKNRILMIDIERPTRESKDSIEVKEKFLNTRNPSAFQFITQYTNTPSTKLLQQIREAKSDKPKTTLTGKKIKNGADLLKKLSNIDVFDGLQLRWQRSREPVFPGLDFEFVDKEKQRFANQRAETQEVKDDSQKSDTTFFKSSPLVPVREVPKQEDFVRAPGGPC